MRKAPARLFVFFALLLLISCNERYEAELVENQPVLITSDLEYFQAVENGESFTTTAPDLFLAGADGRSTDFARSGQFSMRLDSNRKYGLNCEIAGLNEHEFVEVSIWVHRSSALANLQVILKGETSEYRYRSFYNPGDYDTSDWAQHSLSFSIGPDVEYMDVHVFAGSSVAYFDDFSFRKLPQMPANDLETELVLGIPEKSNQKLKNYITEAAGHEAIPAHCKSYVKAFIINGEDSAKVEMKLKGDWTDHLRTGKPSYRIKIKGDAAFEGLKTFSIQHPKTRNYLDEWFVHKMVEKEGLLTTHYDFINVDINGYNKGVYALEEHFDKQLLERRMRREGPILKFDETSYWTAIKQFDSFDSLTVLPFFQQSQVSLFKKNRTRKSPQLFKQFQEGQKLLYLFKEGKAEIDDIFDIDQLAKFYALMEVVAGWHAMRWHNRRFYYNPVTQKLEHIVYDILPFLNGENFRCYMAHKLFSGQTIHENVFDNAILYNKEFKEKYLYYLALKTQPAYLDSLFEEMDAEIVRNEKTIQGELSTYRFDRSIYYRNAEYIKGWIPKLDSVWDEKIAKKEYADWLKPQHYSERKDALFLGDLSVNAYRTKLDSTYLLELENYHLNDVVVHAYRTKDSLKELVLLTEPLRLNGFGAIAHTKDLVVDRKPGKVYFTVGNNPDLIVSKKVMAWPKPKGITTRMELEQSFDANATYYHVSGNKLLFSGKVVLDRLVAIPANYSVYIMPGTSIELQGEGGLIISNSFYAEGTETRPIQIFSTDSLNNGVTVLNGEEAKLSYVFVNGLSNLNYKNWELTGALTFYETPVFMNHCSLTGNNSEDALNIIRSAFTIDDLHIALTTSDGFDADFCTGEIRNSRFVNTGNDCIDFSGSVASISGIAIENSGDKGISGGEASTLTLSDIQIDGAITGIASKDGSVLTGSDIRIANVEFGYSAFQKKPEYAGAKITLAQAELTEAITEILVELGSSITINGKTTEGETKLDIEAMYARFEK